MSNKQLTETIKVNDNLCKREEKRTPICKIFQSLLMNSMKEKEYAELKKSIIDDRGYQQFLIKEISKPILPINHYHNNKFKTRTSSVSDINCTEDKRNIEKIAFCLKQIPGFLRYMQFNGIEEDHIKNAAGFFQHEFFPKGSYVFKQGQLSKRFYGIIRGEISIRITRHKPSERVTTNKRSTIHEDSDGNLRETILYFRKTKIKNQSQENEYEEEKTVFHPGMCFGEWAVIYNIPRTASAYALEDTDLFYLDKEFFDITFSKMIIKTDIEKKNFVIKKIPAMTLAGNIQDILTSLVPVFCGNGEIVYTEFDKAEYLYVVYQGECCLKKLVNAKSREDIENHKKNMKTLFRVDKGGILGLEFLEPKSNYRCTLIASRDFTVLYKVTLKMLKLFIKDIKSFLEPMYHVHRKQIETLLNQISAPPITLKNLIANDTNTNVFDTQMNLSEKFSAYADTVIKNVASTRKLSRKSIHLKMNFKVFNDGKFEGSKDKDIYAYKYKYPPTIHTKTSPSQNAPSMSFKKILDKNKDESILIVPQFKHKLHVSRNHFNSILVNPTMKYSGVPVFFETDANAMNCESISSPIKKVKSPRRSKYIPIGIHKSCQSYDLMGKLAMPRLEKRLEKTLSMWKENKKKLTVTYDSGSFNLPLLSLNSTFD